MADNKLLAAWCHFPIPFGTIVPIIAWLLKHGEDKKLAFQAKQAAVWQVLGGVLVGIVAAVGGMVTAMLALADPAITLLVAGIVMLLVVVLLFVLMVFMALGAIRMMQGKEFYYPIVGKKLK
jgi:uncharacterized Tic20 family protein